MSREDITAHLRRAMAEHTTRLQELDRDFMQENIRRGLALKTEEESIFAALEEVAKSLPDPATGAPMTVTAVRRLPGASDQAFETIGRKEVIYHDCRIAMFEPGLSAGQRRLLFGRAPAGLAPALPTPERVPGERLSPVW